MAIVCGTDFSPLSQSACETAAKLSRTTGEDLIVLHAGSGDDAKKALQRIVDALRHTGAKVMERLESGDPDDAIATVAEEAGASMIVIGATGAEHPRSLLGGTADRLASRVAIPLFLLRDNFPIREWTEAKRELRVTVAADLSPISDNAIAWAQQMTSYGPCAYTLAHIEWPAETYDHMNVEGPLSLDRTHPAVEKAVQRDLEATARKLRAAGPTRVVMESSSGKPAQDLERMAVASKSDTIVVGHQPARSWIVWEGSVARAVMRSSTVSVICVPATDTAAAQGPRYQCVVAATDLSPEGNVAVAHALAIVEERGRVIIVHAIETPDADRNGIADALRQLATGSDNTPRETNVSVEIVEGDDRAEAICNAADRAGADLICIASAGRARLPRILIGSIVQEVLLLSRTPVLVVRPA